MVRRLSSRLALLLVTSFFVVIGGTSAAYAGDTAECVSVGGIQRGCITHIDDGDDFKVCDTHVDDHGVYGAVQEWINGAWVTRDSVVDGGDPTCGYFHFDVTIESWDAYRLKICWPSESPWTCDYDNFRE